MKRLTIQLLTNNSVLSIPWFVVSNLGTVQTWCPCLGTKMDFVQTRQCPDLKMFMKQLGKRIDYREIGDKFGVGSSTACKKRKAVQTSALARARYPSTTSGASSGTSKKLCSDWCPCPGAKSELCLGQKKCY